MKTENSCERLNCICTHTDPCERGWIWFRYPETTRRKDKEGVWQETTKWYDAVHPCRTCDPERAAIFEQAKSNKELGEMLRNRSTAKKQTAYEEQEFNKTRTL